MSRQRAHKASVSTYLGTYRDAGKHEPLGPVDYDLQKDTGRVLAGKSDFF